jgi:hypothetical protein
MSRSICSRAMASVPTNALTPAARMPQSAREIHHSFGSVRLPDRAIDVIPAVKPRSSRRQSACTSAPVSHAIGWMGCPRFDANATAPSANSQE